MAVSAADRVANQVARRNTLPRRECKDPERRAELEANPSGWLRWYLHTSFNRPFERLHDEIIDGAVTAHETNGRFAVAGERGIGKSTLLWGVVLYLKLSGKRMFPICVPWQESAKKRAFRFWRNALCFNPRIADDYPEYCEPFVYSKGVSQRIMATTWADTGEPTGAQLAISEGIIVLPSNLGCIGGSTINANPRGLNHPQEDGTVIRPDIVLLDDVQDRTVAKSERQIEDTVSIIDGDVAGCGEVGRDMPMLMACNCIEPNDVSDHYLSHSSWQSTRIPCIEVWPDGWEDEGGEVKKLWDELWTREQHEEELIEWYAANRDKMTSGMVLSAPSAFDGADNCPDPFYGVIRMYCKMGNDSFMAERQQEPVVEGVTLYNLSRQVICDRADESRAAGIVPEWAQEIFCATDINPSYALTTIIAAFGADQRAAVVWYGTHPMNVTQDMTDAQKSRLISAALAAHGKDIAAMQCRPSRWMIDGGGSPKDCVVNFCSNSKRTCDLESITAFGRAGKAYKHPTKRGKGVKLHEQAHTKMQGMHRQWVLWDADYWREQAQRGWTGTLGAPGSCDLPKGNHKELASQICAELLTGKVELNGRWVYDWKTNTSIPHDYGDCMAMLYALAAVNGIGTGGAGGEVVPTRKKYSQSDLRR